MVDALWITLIGMGLVFIAILVLWGLMALIVRVTAERETPEDDASEADAPEAGLPATSEAGPASTGALESKRRAAAAAVAIALASRKTAQPGRVHEMGSVSAWQAVHRASQLSQRNNASRKKVL